MCLGETARFVVIVDGKPEPDVLWYKVGNVYGFSCQMPCKMSCDAIFDEIVYIAGQCSSCRE